MATLDDAKLMSAAKRAYERGRLSRAAMLGLLITPALAVSASLSIDLALTVGLGVLLVGLVTFGRWHGRSLGAGVRLGLMAGAIPLTFVLAGQMVGAVCVGVNCAPACMAGAAAGGLLGMLVILRSAKIRSVKAWAATSTAFLFGGSGCACFGVVGLLILVGGMAAGIVTAPLMKPAEA